MSIITSLLDTDLYKLTMMQVIFHNYTSTNAEYTYKLRNSDDVYFDDYITREISKEILELCNLRLLSHERKYLETLGYFKENFLDFLEMFHLNIKHINVKYEEGIPEIDIKGPWLYVMLFEIYVMSIISEVYFRRTTNSDIEVEGLVRLEQKIKLIQDHNNPSFKFAEFGGRRRFSKVWHGRVLKQLIESVPNNLVGTSNVMYAYEYGIRPIGTMAHEIIMGHQTQKCKLIDSQKEALQVWSEEYRGSLGTALTDTICMDTFLKDFDLYFAKLFDGARHDSGDPSIWCRKLINHYYNLNIDPKTKTAIFSDGLNIPSAIDLFETFHKEINVSFGIGTNLTNDVGVEPLNHVIKMTKCNGQDVAKISDSSGKTMCKNEEYVNYLKSVFNV